MPLCCLPKEKQTEEGDIENKIWKEKSLTKSFPWSWWLSRNMQTLKREGVGKVHPATQSHLVILNSLTLASSEPHEYSPKSTCPLCQRAAVGSWKVSIQRNSWKAMPVGVMEHHLTLWPETLSSGGNRLSEAQTICPLMPAGSTSTDRTWFQGIYNWNRNIAELVWDLGLNADSLERRKSQDVKANCYIGS